MDCGYMGHPAALDFDHVRGEKVKSVGALVNQASWKRVWEEVMKCDVVCANCHRVRTVTRKEHMQQ